MTPIRIAYLVAAMAAFSAVAASAQGQLPDAPGKEVTVKVCGTCHEAERSAAVRLTREGWEDVMAKMVALGARGTDEELKQVLEYLVENLKGDAPKPLNLNRATAIELESIAGLLRKESAALIAHRTKNGPCKSLDDFKKVPGVPFKKLDERRDRLGCF